ncbi:MAG: hypothetical protein Q4C95_07480 [Planctomycetia bacterium]|nr:hypothetical protein [Planctomycetia bacterium]
MKTTINFAFAFIFLFVFGCHSDSVPVMQDITVPETPQTETEATQPEDEPVMVEAQVGVTGRGQYSASSDYNPMSIYTVPIASYFAAQEMSVFNFSIPQALNLFQASNGYYPKSQQEFDDQIIKANQINLPKLQEGDQYYYDPETAKLMVLTHKKTDSKK